MENDNQQEIDDLFAQLRENLSKMGLLERIDEYQFYEMGLKILGLESA